MSRDRLDINLGCGEMIKEIFKGIINVILTIGILAIVILVLLLS